MALSQNTRIDKRVDLPGTLSVYGVEQVHGL